VKSTHLAPGRPRVRITSEMPSGTTPEAAVQLAQSRAREHPAYRFQVLAVHAAWPEPRVLWDSHAAN
jgi:hypothetical protein